MSDEEDLLKKYTVEGCDDAFAELVQRYSGMVFGTALRKTADRGAAEEVSQNVFTILARKAKNLTASGPLGGWLHRTTLLESRNYLQRVRTQRRKMQALSELKQSESACHSQISEALPLLDDAIDRLSAGDRMVIILRFFEGLSIREIAEATGKSEAASQRQSHRAVQKLSRYLQRKGVVIPVAVVVAQLLPEVSKAAPAQLALSFSNAALQGASSVTTTKLISNTILTMIHIKPILATTAGLAAASAITIPLSLEGNPDDPSTSKAATETAADKPATKVGREAIERKLRAIILPEFDMRGVSVRMAIEHLSLQISELDPDKEGILFQFGGEDPGKALEAENVTMSLARVPASVVLKAIVDLGGVGYVIGDSGVEVGKGLEPIKPPVRKGAHNIINNKLDKIIIPELNFNGATLNEAITFLRIKSRQLDTTEEDAERKGVNFVLKTKTAGTKVGLNLRNVTLGVALKQVTEAAEVSYEVRPFGVVIGPLEERPKP